MTAVRQTPTQANGGSDNGVDYTNAVNVEIAGLWQCVKTELVSVGGTSTAITASSDTTFVAAITAYARPMAFWLTPAYDWPGGPGTINIDDVGAVALTDQDGNNPVAGTLKAGRRTEISFDGAVMRISGGGGGGGGGSGATVQDVSINGGRLTISSGVPVLTGAVSGATSALWTPDRCNLIALYDGAAWGVISSPEAAIPFTNAQSGATHSGTKVIDGLADTSQLMIGMKISGTGVGAGSVIASIDTPTQVTGTVNSTASASVTVTFTVPANTAVDIFAKNNSSVLLLQGVLRAAFMTSNAMTKQDGVDVLAADKTLRWLGTVATAATDGQVSWALTGQYRYRVWNRDNKHTVANVEAFATSGTWYPVLGLRTAQSEIYGGGGAGSVLNGAGFAQGSGGAGGYSMKRWDASTLNVNKTVTLGPTSVFAGAHSATTGGSGTSTGAPGTGSGGDINITGGGHPGGASNTSGASVPAGGSPLIKVTELIEY